MEYLGELMVTGTINKKSFTYAKLTVQLFVKLLGIKEIGAGISFFVGEDELSYSNEFLKE